MFIRIRLLVLSAVTAAVALFVGSLTAEPLQNRALVGADRNQPVQITQPPGDAERGRRLYQSARLGCRTCHSLREDDPGIGPSLFGVGDRLSVEGIVESILNPSAKYASGYKPLTLTMKDGRMEEGMEVVTDEHSITLRLTEGRRLRIEKAHIDHVQVGPSRMPTGLVDHLSPQEFADVVEFLSQLRTAN